MKSAIVFAASFMLTTLTGPAVSAETITELDLDPGTYNERTVVVTGELVGDFGRRGGLVWTQINDDEYVDSPIREGGQLVGGNTGLALAVEVGLFDRTLAAQAPGGYRTRGPIVEVTAVFHYHDPSRSGETWLEATRLTVVEPARPMSEPKRLPLALAGVTLGVVGYVLHIRGRRTI